MTPPTEPVPVTRDTTIKEKPMTLVWTQEIPTKEGAYLIVDEYGTNRGLVLCHGGATKQTPLMRTHRGLMDVWGCWFAEFDPTETFSPEMVASIKARCDAHPAEELARAEEQVRRHPRSPKAKERLEEVRRKVAAARTPQ